MTKIALLLTAAITAACSTSGGPPPRSPLAGARDASPLGPSYVLIPLPGEDAGLLGRVIANAPEPGRSLEEIAQPNPCGSALEAPAESAVEASFENAEELAMGAAASATLGLYGFRGEANKATHFVYRVQTDKQVQQRDTVQYAECCKTSACGYGYIAGLVHGQGEYSAAEETRARGSVDIAFASGEGGLGLKVLERRKVKGWVAAIVRVTGNGASAQLGPLGVPPSEVSVAGTPEQYKGMFDRKKISVCQSKETVENDGRKEPGWTFCDANGEMTENGFVRKYRGQTGSDELDYAESNRSGTKWWMWAGIPVGLALGVVGLVMTDGNFGQPKTGGQVAGFIMSIEGFGLALGTGIALPIVHFGNSEGRPVDHDLSESDGRYYADQHNRALLRGLMRDAQRSPGAANRARPMPRHARRAPNPGVRIVVGPGVVAGTF